MSDPVTLDLGCGRSLHACRQGRGDDLLLLHGALTTHVDWLGGPFERLAKRFRVTAIDRPGHGRSRRGRFEGSPREQARQIEQGLDALGIGRLAIVGHSMGGMVALALAERLGPRVTAMVLVAPLAFPELRPLEHFLLAPRALPVAGPLLSAAAEASFDRPLLHAVHRIMFAPQPVPEAWQARYPYGQILDERTMVREGEEAAAILPFSPQAIVDYRAIAAPATILVGTADRVVNPTLHAHGLARLLPASRLVELPGIGHMAHCVAPLEVAEAIGEGVLAG